MQDVRLNSVERRLFETIARELLLHIGNKGTRKYAQQTLESLMTGLVEAKAVLRLLGPCQGKEGKPFRTIRNKALGIIVLNEHPLTAFDVIYVSQLTENEKIAFLGYIAISINGLTENERQSVMSQLAGMKAKEAKTLIELADGMKEKDLSMFHKWHKIAKKVLPPPRPQTPPRIISNNHWSTSYHGARL